MPSVQQVHARDLLVFLLDLTWFHRLTGGGGQLLSPSLSESVRPGGPTSSCSSDSSRSKGFWVAGMPATSLLRSGTLESPALGGFMAATLTPHKTTGLTVPARAGPAFGFPPFLGQSRAKWGPWQIQQPRKFGGRFAELRSPDACRPVGCPLPLPLFPSPPLPLSPPLPVPFQG